MQINTDTGVDSDIDIHVNVAINAQGVCILFGTSLQRAPQTSLAEWLYGSFI